ncbi:methyltransferase domain-containing protein [Tateyamaria sp. SN6-1]|uniref:methyltransferase domain-containing protein n=1 Tax=Tateyamaria sp. SN6-1 TaxID=3092148 RepID=UPI0039F4619D
MTQPNLLTDPDALRRNRDRATTDGLFLQDTARDELQDRVDLVNKPFLAPAVVTAFPQIWPTSYPVVADTDVLQLEPGAHDLVIHSLGLHWANDPVGQLIQCRRALKPDGLLLAASLGGQTLHELRSSLAEAEIALNGGLSPRVAPMADLRDLGALLQRAGLALPVADSVPLRVKYRDMWHLMRDLRAMGETNALATRLRRPTARALFERAADIYAATFADGDGIIATFELVILTGWAPDASQPQPLRPGSATARLADALGADETPLPD